MKQDLSQQAMKKYTKDNLNQSICKRKEMSIYMEESSKFCALCKREKENIDHLFVHCEFTQFLWCRFQKMTGISWCMPRSVALVFEAWRMLPFFRSVRVCVWTLIPFAIS